MSTHEKNQLSWRRLSVVINLQQQSCLILRGFASLNCSRRAPGYFAVLVARFHLPHATEVRLHVRNINVVILTPETADSIWRLDFPSRMKPWMLPGAGHRGLATTRMLFTCSLTSSVLGQNCLYPVGQHTVAVYTCRTR